jgi:hypothetical protein
MIPDSKGSPKSIPANLIPAAPPKRLPARSPKSAKSTIPAPAPMYAVFLERVIFILLSSFSFSLALYIAGRVPKHNCLNLR